jgi:Universal stress protein UspA and related nucleotide-binding proteins|nr:universal stress protein [uncultured Steroidobacter sp.]
MTRLSLISRQQPLAIKAHVGPALGSTGFRLMCATDLWGESDHALQKALWLAEEMDAELLLLHVVDGETPLRISGRRAEHARGALEWHVRRWPDFKPRPAISVRIGNPHRTISRVAREWCADLIVLGSSRPRLMDRLLATTAERTAADARCSVLVVNDSKPEAYRHVTVVAPSCWQAVALEQAMSRLEVLLASPHMDVSIGAPNASLLTQPPDCVIVAADRWPALTGLFRRSRASMLAQSRAMDVLIVPHRSVAVA